MMKSIKENVTGVGISGGEQIIEEPTIEELEPNLDIEEESLPLEQLSGEPFFGMEIESVSGNENQVVVVTTGAVYDLRRTYMNMWRRVNPSTNSINNRMVAKLNFAQDIGPLTIESADTRTAVIRSSKSKFQFSSDSLFFVNATSSLTYTHTNLIINAPWNRGRKVNNMYLDRMWTDGYGGSLHAFVNGNPSATNTTDTTTFNMNNGDSIAHMVFPPKLFDFERLYGENARPFVQFTYGYDNLRNEMNRMDLLNEEGFGVYVLHESGGLYYTTDEYGWTPEELESGIRGYEYANEELIHEFVDLAHENGFKVVTYMLTPPTYENHPDAGEIWGDQDIEVTMQWMVDFQEEFNLDGWYFDNFDPINLLEAYNFIRWVRTNISDDGIIYYHNSEDLWGSYSGARGIFIEAYVDYIMPGEHGPEVDDIDDPNNPYFRYYTAGYGMSQAFASHLRDPHMKIAIFEEEKNRVIGENLNGAERVYTPEWISHFKPVYDIRREEYLSGNFNQDVDWPIDTNNGWFRNPINVQIVENNETSVTVRWQTTEPATTDLAWTNNSIWEFTWSEDYLDGPTCGFLDSTLTTQHSVVAHNLIPGVEYEFRIRSSNKKDVPEEIIWGDVFTYTTGEQQKS